MLISYESNLNKQVSQISTKDVTFDIKTSRKVRMAYFVVKYGLMGHILNLFKYGIIFHIQQNTDYSTIF